VVSTDPRVDCIGACVGVRGTRIKSIIDEVKGEKIDIIPWSDAPETLIADSLRPAEILQITLEEGEHTRRATVTVPEDQLSLAIGWKGQNVRLAVKMTGWDIDIEPPEREPSEEAPAKAAGSGEPGEAAAGAAGAAAASEQAAEAIAVRPGSTEDAGAEPPEASAEPVSIAAESADLAAEASPAAPSADMAEPVENLDPSAD